MRPIPWNARSAKGRCGSIALIDDPGVIRPRYYAPPPRRVVIHHRPAVVYNRPAPVYYAQPAYSASVSEDAALRIFAGAAIGALIGYELSH